MIDIKKKTEEGELQQVMNFPFSEFVWIPQFINLAGSVVYNTDREPNDVDVVVRADENNGRYYIELDKSLRLKIDRQIQEALGVPSDNWNSVDWIATTYGPNWKFMSLFDLVLRPIKNPTLTSMNEPDFEDKFYKDVSDTIQIIDEKLKEPEKNKQALLADLRYLGNSGYPKIISGKSWGGWDKENLLLMFAKIVDTLRSIGLELKPPMFNESVYKTSYWKCYRASIKYITSAEVSQDIKIKKPECRDITIFVKQADEQIVYGVVYSPNEVDSQDDMTTSEEIQKACYHYMEMSRNVKTFHRGREIKFNILENFLAPTDFMMTAIDGLNQHVPKGSWILCGRVVDPKIWKQVRSGEIRGFSMAGIASSFS